MHREVNDMPYVMVDSLADGQEEAYVVDKNQFDAMESDRDALLKRAVEAEDAYKQLKDKYVKAFMETKPPETHTVEPKPPVTLDNLFA